MVDSRDKGTRAEYQVRDILRTHTGLKWERVPGSGGFNASHGLKGDLYIPEVNGKYCTEVKHYKDDVINSNLFNDSNSTLEQFWEQTEREAGQINKEPLLVFRKDRGKWLLATMNSELIDTELVFTTERIEYPIYIYMFAEWLKTKESGDFLNG